MLYQSKFHKRLFSHSEDYYFLHKESLKPIAVEPYMFLAPRWLSHESELDIDPIQMLCKGRSAHQRYGSSYSARFYPEKNIIRLESLYSGFGPDEWDYDENKTVLACHLRHWEEYWDYTDWAHIEGIHMSRNQTTLENDLILTLSHSYSRNEYILLLFRKHEYDGHNRTTYTKQDILATILPEDFKPW